ncbi:MAG: tetratricopeptide repeat protein [Bacteroidia bacterium]|nr:tetratricopeptide repeat protein [Bacteroidia bacterium]
MAFLLNTNSKNMNNQIIIIIIILVIIGQNVWAQDSPTSELDKARQLIMQGQKQDVNVILGKLMASEPDNKTAVQYWLMANMKRSPTGELDAIVQLDSLHNLYPQNTGIIFFKNFILAEYGKNEEALAGLNELIQLQPDTALNWIGKGQVLSEMKRHQEAVEAFEKALSLDPTRFDVWGMEATALSNLKKIDEALVCINKGIDLNPGYAGNIYSRACIYCLKGDKFHALADLKTAVEKNPQLKQHARKDEDFKILWNDDDFIKLTE